MVLVKVISNSNCSVLTERHWERRQRNGGKEKREREELGV